MVYRRPFTVHRHTVDGERFTVTNLRCDVDFDLLRLGFFTKGKLDAEHAVFVLGFDPVRIDRVRQRERTSERAVAPLDPVELFVLDRLLGLLLAANRQREVLDRDVEVFLAHARNLGFDHQLVFARAVNIDGWHPGTTELTEWIPTNDCHASSPFLISRGAPPPRPVPSSS